MRHAFEDTAGVLAGGLRLSLDHLIRPLQERRRHRETEGLRHGVRSEIKSWS
jgi:hypothetical protein